MFASETYGKKLAEIFSARYIPVDPNRESVPVSGTQCRQNIDDPAIWNLIEPAMAKHLVRTVTLFGPESVGKTTMAKDLGQIGQCTVLPEYARGYLEHTGTNLTSTKLVDIFLGQITQQMVHREAPASPYIVQDTDHFTTIGWVRLFMPRLLEAVQTRIDICGKCKSMEADLYLILDDSVPFVPDSQRYGGDKRQTNTSYWVNLAEEMSLNYRLIKGPNYRDRLYQAVYEIETFFPDRCWL